eukprot:350891-Chlamydomonas_euryale.AAC.12
MCTYIQRHWSSAGPSQRMLYNHMSKQAHVVETAVRGGGQRGGAVWLSGRGRLWAARVNTGAGCGRYRVADVIGPQPKRRVSQGVGTAQSFVAPQPCVRTQLPESPQTERKEFLWSGCGALPMPAAAPIRTRYLAFKFQMQTQPCFQIPDANPTTVVLTSIPCAACSRASTHARWCLAQLQSDASCEQASDPCVCAFSDLAVQGAGILSFQSPLNVLVFHVVG